MINEAPKYPHQNHASQAATKVYGLMCMSETDHPCFLQARDELKNRRLCGGDVFVVRLEGPSELDGTVKDHNNGTYTASYTPTLAGVHQLHLLNGMKFSFPCREIWMFILCLHLWHRLNLRQ